MEIKKIIISNCEDIEYGAINFENLMIFVGEANKGKTSLIKAISAIFSGKIEDVNFGDKSKEIELRIKYFTKEKGFLTLKILKKIDEEVKYFLLDHKVEKEIDENEKNIILNRINIVRIETRDDSIKDSLESFLKNLKKEKMKELILKKIEFLKKSFISQGVQRRILLDFFKEINEIIKIDEEEKNELKGIMFIFEEPELHLNPQESRELYAILIKLSNLGIKIIIKTYSSYFIGLKQYKSICLIRKLEGKVKISQYFGTLFSGDEIKDFNMNYWINPDRGEMFFAKKVILVEGQTDKIVISALAKRIGKYRFNYSIIECGSKSIIPQFIRVLNAFRIPYIAVYDKDNHFWRDENELRNSNMKNHQIQRYIKRDIGEYLEFENDIEEEIYSERRERKNYKNKPYYALQTVVSENYKIPERLLKKIEQIYK